VVAQGGNVVEKLIHAPVKPVKFAFITALWISVYFIGYPPSPHSGNGGGSAKL
jgi:hypothetical protein